MMTPVPSFKEVSKSVSTRARLVQIGDYATVRAVARSPSFAPIDLGSYLRDLQDASGRDLTQLIQLARNIPFFLDGPRHLELRGLSASLLSRSRIRLWEPHLERITEHFLDRLAHQHNPDLIRDYADPLVQVGLGMVLGIQDGDSKRMCDWGRETRWLLEPLLSIRRLLRLQNAIEEMTQHIATTPVLRTPDAPRPVLEELMDHLSEDFTYEDAIALAIVLFIAGQTTAQTLGNILLDILQAPAEQRLRASDPNELTAHLDTLLRLHASPQYIDRVARVDQEVGSCPFKAGDRAHLHLVSANRDETLFLPHDPQQGNDRAAARHLSFGTGVHKCPGEAFARTFLGIALPRVLRRYPSLSLAVARPERALTEFTLAPRALPCQLNSKGS